MNTVITKAVVPEHSRARCVDALFGIHFPLQLEPFVFHVAGRLAKSYRGGCWRFYRLSNGGFYMAPESDEPFHVCCDNCYEGTLSADALGIVACMYAYSHLSFADDPRLGRLYASHYHLLREHMTEHPEVAAILRAVD